MVHFGPEFNFYFFQSPHFLEVKCNPNKKVQPHVSMAVNVSLAQFPWKKTHPANLFRVLVKELKNTARN